MEVFLWLINHATWKLVKILQRSAQIYFLQENEKTRDIIIEQRFHRTIIGAKGEKIREIKDKFNQVQVTFPDPGKKSDIVTLRGPKNDVDKCYKYLQTLQQEMVRKINEMQMISRNKNFSINHNKTRKIYYPFNILQSWLLRPILKLIQCFPPCLFIAFDETNI